MIFLSAWILQGIRIMNWREAFVKVAFTVIFAVLFAVVGVPVVLSILIAHTLNFAFNGQLFAMYTHMGATHVTAEHFLKETEKIAKLCEDRTFVDASIAYGSLSRGCFKSTSDIDMRIVPVENELSWWEAVFFALWLRTRSFVNGYPLDLYVYPARTCAKRMRSDELPIMLSEKDGCMRNVYPERVELNEFITIFKEQNIN